MSEGKAQLAKALKALKDAKDELENSFMPTKRQKEAIVRAEKAVEAAHEAVENEKAGGAGGGAAPASQWGAKAATSSWGTAVVANKDKVRPPVASRVASRVRVRLELPLPATVG